MLLSEEDGRKIRADVWVLFLQREILTLVAFVASFKFLDEGVAVIVAAVIYIVNSSIWAGVNTVTLALKQHSEKQWLDTLTLRFGLGIIFEEYERRQGIASDLWERASVAANDDINSYKSVEINQAKIGFTRKYGAGYIGLTLMGRMIGFAFYLFVADFVSRL